MTNYEVIRQRLESLPTNLIGKKRLNILNISTEMNQSVDDVKQVVEDLINEGRLKFHRSIVTERSKSYNTEYLQVIKQRKTIRKTNKLF